MPICTQGMQRTWWPEAGTIIVTGPYWPNSQIPERTCSICHSAPFRIEMCTFLFWIEHCGIWNRCILGFVKLVYHYATYISRTAIKQTDREWSVTRWFICYRRVRILLEIMPIDNQSLGIIHICMFLQTDLDSGHYRVMEMVAPRAVTAFNWLLQERNKMAAILQATFSNAF